MENNRKRVALVTLHTPTRENVRGASALPYHLAKHRPNGVDLKIYTFNGNKVDMDQIKGVSDALNSQIQIIKPRFHYKWLKFSNKMFPLLRAFLSYPMAFYLSLNKSIIKEINNWATEVWIYGEELAHLADKFPNKKSVVTTPDCEAMYYQRVLSMPSKLNSYFKIIRYGRAYWQYLNLAKNFPTENVVYHLVGKEDAEFLKKINPKVKALFIPHPHYEGNTDRQINFGSPKIRLLLPGRYDFYSKEAVDEIISSLMVFSELAQNYEVTFQGKNWDKPAEKLAKAGFSVHVKGFVPDYKDELCLHDIQLSPISLGTGTKGKVLDAFVNGLLVIAPLRAIENIQVRDKKDFFFYSSANELLDILKSIPKDIEAAESMAEEGRSATLKNHSVLKVSDLFFQLFEKNNQL